MFERLKTSRRLQIEVALAGFAIWQLKRELNRRSESPEEPAPPSPVNEMLGETTIFVYPTEFDEAGEPRAIKVGSIEDEGILSVQGVLVEARKFVIEGTSVKSRDKLIDMKEQIRATGKLLRERAAKNITTSKSH